MPRRTRLFRAVLWGRNLTCRHWRILRSCYRLQSEPDRVVLFHKFNGEKWRLFLSQRAHRA